jgi:hypothetical protein
MTITDLGLANGEHLRVAGAVEEIEKTLENAARSGQSRLAWLTEADTEATIGVNPAHVATVRVEDGPG